jgi:hypothetical protein
MRLSDQPTVLPGVLTTQILVSRVPHNYFKMRKSGRI